MNCLIQDRRKNSDIFFKLSLGSTQPSDVDDAESVISKTGESVREVQIPLKDLQDDLLSDAATSFTVCAYRFPNRL